VQEEFAFWRLVQQIHLLSSVPSAEISVKVISGKISEASGFCPVPVVNGNGIFVFRNHLKTISRSKNPSPSMGSRAVKFSYSPLESRAVKFFLEIFPVLL